MSKFSHVATQVSFAASHMTSVSDMLVLEGAAGAVVYTLNRQEEGGILAFDPAQSNAPLQLKILPDRGGINDARGLLSLELNGQQTLLTYGQNGRFLDGYTVMSSGLLGSAISVDLGLIDGQGYSLASLELLEVGTERFLFGTAHDTAGMLIWQETAAGGFELSAPPQLTTLLASNTTSTLMPLMIGGQAHVLSAAHASSRLDLLALGADGTLEVVQIISAQDGLAVAQPTLLKLAETGGQQFVLVGAPGSGSIVVMRVGSDEQLHLVSQVNDDQNTRFAGVTILEVVQTHGRVFVLAGGADDGLSLFSLLTNGQLVHLDTLIDDNMMALADLQSVVVVTDSSGIDVVVVGDHPDTGSGADMGITQLRVELGPQGQVAHLSSQSQSYTGGGARDQIVGGSGNDVINGAGGDDVLADGAGSDSLTGGAGSDLFVMSADERIDWITDFQIGSDRIDLTGWSGLYDSADLQATTTQSGIRLTFGNEEIVVNSASGGSLSLQAMIDAGSFQNNWAVSVAPHSASDMVMTGSSRDDFLRGYAGDDKLFGGLGGDWLQGGGGDDFLHGGSGETNWDPYLAQVVRLYKAALDRAPDTGGLTGWAAQLETGQTELVSVAYGFVASQEFGQTYGATNNEDFVRLLYNNVLDREPDAGGLASWVFQLESGAMSRARVVIGFSESLEFINSMELEGLSYSAESIAMKYSDDVFRLYQATLGRVPDLNGYLSWGDEISHGRDFDAVVRGFVLSTEFQQNYGALGNADFVNLLYRNVLNRDADSSGLVYWQGALDGGTKSREQVVTGFSQSAEFIAKTKPDYFNWVRSKGTDDRLEGQSGQNVLFGGRMSDEFVFTAGEGSSNDVIGLEAFDVVRLTGYDYGSWGQLRSHLSQEDGFVLFSDQDTDIRFWNTSLSTLNSEMFEF